MSGRERAWEQQCRGKRKHSDRDGAVGARENMAQRDRDLLVTLSPYRCPHCQCWHLGRARDAAKRLRRRDRREEKARRKTLRTAPGAALAGQEGGHG